MTATDAAPAKRWRPILNYDNRLFREGVNEGKLLIQRCSDCETLRYPPGSMCPQCQSMQWDTSCIKPEDVSIGIRVELAIPEVEEGLSLPLFKHVN